MNCDTPVNAPAAAEPFPTFGILIVTVLATGAWYAGWRPPFVWFWLWVGLTSGESVKNRKLNGLGEPTKADAVGNVLTMVVLLLMTADVLFRK